MGGVAVGALLVCLGLVASSAEEHYYPAATCISSCDAGHKCLSDECVERWDDCTQGYDLMDGLEFVQMSKEILFDEQDCYDNGCSFGGCDKPGYAEKSKEACSNVLDAYCLFCYREKCCRLREWVRCCPRLDCIKELAGCPQVPQQEASSPSASSIFYTKLASGGAAVLPFYLEQQVGFGEDCAAQRVLGACTCLDGAKLPGGCLASDSATWAAWNGTHALEEPLPPGLSLTCTALPAPDPPPMAAPPPSAATPDASSTPTPAGASNSTGSETQPGAAAPSDTQSSTDAAGGSDSTAGGEGAGGSEAGGGGGQSSMQAGGEGEAGGGVVDGGGAARKGERGGGGRSRAWVAGIIAAVSVVSTLAVLAVIAGTVACLRIRHQSHIRTTDAYQAMLTGTSYTPPMKVRAPVMGVVKHALQRLLGRKESLVPDSSRMESGSLQEPAVPPDDELFTLEDLESSAPERQGRHRGQPRSRHAKWHDKRGKYGTGKDVEMQEQAGLLSQGQRDAADITTHTIPLDDDQEVAENGHQGGSKPITPQPTGEGRKRPSGGNPSD